MIALTTMAAAANGLGMVISPYGMLYFRGANYGENTPDTFAKYMLGTIRALHQI